MRLTRGARVMVIAAKIPVSGRRRVQPLLARRYDVVASSSSDSNPSFVDNPQCAHKRMRRQDGDEPLYKWEKCVDRLVARA